VAARARLPITDRGLRERRCHAQRGNRHHGHRDGPLLVRGPFRLVDQDGREIERDREVIALCRCGKSRVRPFCDAALGGPHSLGSANECGSASLSWYAERWIMNSFTSVGPASRST
jgi:CDGSH-type Zn-finger protein